MKKMICLLCKKSIANYQPRFNSLKINKANTAEVCSECIDKFVKWQQNIYATLFPTKAVKKWQKK